MKKKEKNIIISLKLIKILSDGKFHSSSSLSNILKISSFSIKNYITILKNWGIFFIKNNFLYGYKISKPIQLLNLRIILSILKKNKKDVFIIPIINSTNQYLIDRIDTINKGTVCISEYQKNGRGRYGKKWISPFGTNIYLSIYWNFKETCIQSSIGISIVCGIGLARVLKKHGVKNIKIKWPNDIYLNEKKLAGILVEIIQKNNSNFKKIIIGIGLNLNMQLNNKKIINQKWINLEEIGISIDRNYLVAVIIDEIQNILLEFEKNGLSSFIKEWLNLDIYLNKPIRLIFENHCIYGISRGINKIGALLLERDSLISSWLNGKISVRKN